MKKIVPVFILLVIVGVGGYFAWQVYTANQALKDKTLDLMREELARPTGNLVDQISTLLNQDAGVVGHGDIALSEGMHEDGSRPTSMEVLFYYDRLVLDKPFKFHLPLQVHLSTKSSAAFKQVTNVKNKLNESSKAQADRLDKSLNPE